MAFKPLIGVTACVKQIGLHPYHISGDKYLRAVSVAALGLPVVIPSLGELTDIDDLLAQLDGLLLTGSPSNVEPFHYHGPASAPADALRRRWRLKKNCEGSPARRKKATPPR